MDINQLVLQNIPSKENLSSDLTLESDLTSAIRKAGGELGKSAASNKKGLAIAGGTLAGGAGVAYGANKVRQYFADKEARTADNLSDLAKQSQGPVSLKVDPNHVATVTKNTLAGKTGDMTTNMGKAAGQWGQSLKSGLGGVADFAANNPHLALAGSALGGLAAIKKLRRR